MLVCRSSLTASEYGETKIQENGELWERGGNGTGQRNPQGIPMIDLKENCALVLIQEFHPLSLSLHKF